MSDLPAGVTRNYPLARLTTIRAGGPAELFARPGSIAELEVLLAWAGEHVIDVGVVGSGSNLLVADSGVGGLVLKLDQELSEIEVDGTRINCGGGARLPAVSARAARAGLSGIEFGVNIPGTVGGAVRMNANAYGGELARALAWVDVVNATGTQRRTPDQLGFAYRRSSLAPGEVVARAAFALQPAPAEEVGHTLADMRRRRKEAQPSGIKTFGSTFKNPSDPRAEGRSAGQLLEAAGCRGLRMGGAAFSEKHANFVENLGEATTADVVALMAEGRRRVKERFGVELEPEVQALGPVDLPSDWRGDLMGSGRSSFLRWTPAGMRAAGGSHANAGGIERHPSQTLTRRRLRGLRRPRPRTLVALVALILLLGGVWLWLRDSSLVAVHRVRVTGASGPDASEIRSALALAAHNMTTLDVNMKQLRTAVAPYPVVKRLDVTTQFPHGMRIRVIEQVPVAILDAGGRKTAVAGDGTLLHDATANSTLPIISLQVVPGGTHVTGYALAEVRLLAAAPYPLLGKVDTVSDGAAHGLVAKLRNGPSVYFGDSTQLGIKWTAAAQVLADSRSAGAAYIDVTDPSRPAAGAGAGGDVNGSSASAGGAVATTASQNAPAAVSPSSQAAAGTSASTTPSSSSPGG